MDARSKTNLQRPCEEDQFEVSPIPKNKLRGKGRIQQDRGTRKPKRRSQKILVLERDPVLKFLALAKFSYNNSYQTSIKIVPYKDLYRQNVELYCIGLN